MVAPARTDSAPANVPVRIPTGLLPPLGVAVGGPPLGGTPEGPCRSWTAPERCGGLLNESRLTHGCERDELVVY